MWPGSPDWPSSQRGHLLPMSAAHVLNNCNDKLATAKLGPNSIAPGPDVVLEFPAIFALAYDRGRYARALDYAAPLDLPLAAVDRAWAEEHARASRF